MKARKIQEAKDLIRNAEKKLETGFFKRSKDYFGAAPLYADAARCYEAAGEKILARDTYLLAADCETQSNALYAAGERTERAALLSSQVLDNNDCKIKSIELYKKCSTYYRESNNHEKGAQALLKASNILETLGNKDESITLLEEVVDIYINQVSLEFGIEPCRKLLNYYLKEKKLKNAIELTRLMIESFTKLNQPHNVYKCNLSLIIMYLGQNDVAAARQEFMDHLQDSQYLKSKECEISENLLIAVEQFDEEKLTQLQSGNSFAYLDTQVTKLAKELRVDGVAGEKKKPPPKVEPTDNKKKPQPDIPKPPEIKKDNIDIPKSDVNKDKNVEKIKPEEPEKNVEKESESNSSESDKDDDKEEHHEDHDTSNNDKDDDNHDDYDFDLT